MSQSTLAFLFVPKSGPTKSGPVLSRRRTSGRARGKDAAHSWHTPGSAMDNLLIMDRASRLDLLTWGQLVSPVALLRLDLFSTGRSLSCMNVSPRMGSPNRRSCYRVNFEVTTLKPFSHLPFPHCSATENIPKQPSFDGKLMASFSSATAPSGKLRVFISTAPRFRMGAAWLRLGRARFVAPVSRQTSPFPTAVSF